MLSSCESQIGTAVGAAFTNLLTGAGFRSSSGTEAYEALKNETLGQSGQTEFGGGCKSPDDALTVIGSKDSKNMSAIKDKICTCEAWGTCDSKSCSCQMLCPKKL